MSNETIIPNVRTEKVIELSAPGYEKCAFILETVYKRGESGDLGAALAVLAEQNSVDNQTFSDWSNVVFKAKTLELELRFPGTKKAFFVSKEVGEATVIPNSEIAAHFKVNLPAKETSA